MRNELITPEYGPLHGMRVMLSGSALAGPWTARMMGDYGAEIIKIETPKVGDTSRSGPRHPSGIVPKWDSIDRNTMTPVKSLADDGSYIDTTECQISLAHAMSLDHETRAENTVDAVSTLLGGHKIDGFAMVNMSAIEVVNDMVGGVTVTIEDDFPDSDTLIKGQTVTLHGKDAERFIRERKTVADGLNENRMSRQAQYEEAFKPVFQAKCSEDKTFPLDLYHALEDYMTTNISAKKFSRLALLLSDEKEEEKVSIEGTADFDEDGWQTFTPDPDSLQEAILSLFYKEKK